MPASDNAGLLPISLLRFLPTVIDFRQHVIRYYLGEEIDLAGFQQLKAEFVADYPGGAEKAYVFATVKGLTTRLLVDTGASNQIFLFPKFVAKQGLWDAATDFEPATATGENGDTLDLRVERGQTVGLGGIQFEGCNLSLADPKKAQATQAHQADGIVGAGLLRRLDLAFGKGNSLYARPNGLV